MHGLIQARPLATIVTLSTNGIEANHVPLHLSPGEGQYGTLRGHIARSNSMLCEMIQDLDALAVFHGPDSYISPSWYPTKKEHGRAVPTWNYAVVHAYGPLRIIDNAAWLFDHLQTLTTQHETGFDEPWKISDAPSDFTEKLLGAITGIEITITRLNGKWKASQNQPPTNQAGIVEGLNEREGARELEMADLITQVNSNKR